MDLCRHSSEIDLIVCGFHLDMTNLAVSSFCLDLELISFVSNEVLRLQVECREIVVWFGKILIDSIWNEDEIYYCETVQRVKIFQMARG